MSKTTEHSGNLCNQIIQNLSLSILAEKYDLWTNYSNYNNINNKLGIELFKGNKIHNKTITMKCDNYMNYYNNNIENNANFNFMNCFFQNEEITTILHKHLKDKMKNIINKNPYKERYNNNNDIFIHIRLGGGSVRRLNVGLKYYIYFINSLNYDNIYIGSDNFNDNIIKEIKNLYPTVILFKENPIETIQFGSTCKNIVLSHGSFSAVIGYLGFFSNIYFLNREPGWCPLGMFINKGFIPIDPLDIKS